MRSARLRLIFGTFLVALLSFSYVRAQTPDPHSVPAVDGDAGPCTADFTVTDNAGKPIYDAHIKVHIAYRAFGWHKLDLDVGTNVDGKARFAGLPSKTKQGLFFQASKENRSGSAFDDTSATCKAQFTVALEEAKPSAGFRARAEVLLSDFTPEVAEPQIPPSLWHLPPASPIITFIALPMRRAS
jgi:hypothetical protein